jgi:enamine deaminase RidA (YjgF/YER057c/UK114 family)
MLVMVQRLRPEGLSNSPAFSQVVVASGRRMVFISGQVSLDREGKLVAPGDLAGQARQVFANLATALEAAGAKPADVTKMTIFIVGYRPEMRAVIGEARTAFLGGGEPPASTLVGVQGLADPGFMLEVEATAVID